jgi:hypothetical protein
MQRSQFTEASFENGWYHYVTKDVLSMMRPNKHVKYNMIVNLEVRCR